MKKMVRKKSQKRKRSRLARAQSTEIHLLTTILSSVWRMFHVISTIALKLDCNFEFQSKAWRKNKKRKSLNLKFRIKRSTIGMKTTKRSTASLFGGQLQLLVVKCQRSTMKKLPNFMLKLHQSENYCQNKKNMIKFSDTSLKTEKFRRKKNLNKSSCKVSVTRWFWRL